MTTATLGERKAPAAPELAGIIGTTEGGGTVLLDVTPLDDSGDDRSRLWRITWWSLAWIGVALPAAVACDRVTGAQALDFLRWILPLVLGIFGAIKAGQKVAGAAVRKK